MPRKTKRSLPANFIILFGIPATGLIVYLAGKIFTLI